MRSLVNNRLFAGNVINSWFPYKHVSTSPTQHQLQYKTGLKAITLCFISHIIPLYYKLADKKGVRYWQTFDPGFWS